MRRLSGRGGRGERRNVGLNRRRNRVQETLMSCDWLWRGGRKGKGKGKG